MTVDFTHNKTVRETLSDKFAESIRTNLLPILADVYGDRLTGIQMYEDYISDSFSVGTLWYYPMTAILGDRHETIWISFDMKDKSSFKGGIPYAYVGAECLKFSIAEDVPAEFMQKLEGRNTYFPGGMTIEVQSTSDDPTFLIGKYAQDFIDEMARQLDDEICRAFSIKNLAGSTVRISMVFAPGTYMEHITENVTYRRLLITAKGCSTRDFWVKWTHNTSAFACPVNAHIRAGEVTFEIGEDVPQKIREREYRFLTRVGTDKYQLAMGRKNITEWREIIKRAIKRDEVERTDTSVPVDQSDINLKLNEILRGEGIKTPAADVGTNSGYGDDILAACRSAISQESNGEVYDATEDAPLTPEVGAEEAPAEVAPAEEVTFELSTDEDEETPATAEAVPEKEEPAPEVTESPAPPEERAELAALRQAAKAKAEAEERARAEAEERHRAEELAEAAREADLAAKRAEEDRARRAEEERAAMEAKIRAEVEAKLRLEAEEEKRRKAEEENERLRREQDELRRENERLTAMARKAEQDRLTEEVRRRAEEQRREEETAKLKAEIEARAKQEQRERELIAEAARKSLEEERARLEREHLEAQRRAEERARAEAEARLAEQQRLEEERRRAEEEERARLRAEAEARAKIEAEARARAEAAAKAEEEARAKAEIAARAEAEARAKAEAAARARAEAEKARTYTYVRKVVKLMFRYPVDPNVTKRIQDLISSTMKYFHKEDVYIRVKATIPDNSTVVLDFLKFPEEEMELLMNIIKVLGRSDIGVSKITLE